MKESITEGVIWFPLNPVLNKKEIILPNLSSYERRIVHMYLSERSDIKTESRGVPPLRQMVVIPV